MKADFWHNRWENDLTGFHLDEVNPYLVEYWHGLNLDNTGRVFVPLCGKTLDLLWLSEQGHPVVGVELSALAVEAFFVENKIEVERQTIGDLALWKSENISLFCGDIFNLTSAILGQINAVYDRASLIALPPAMRQDYAKKLIELTPSAPKLLITLEYEQTKMDGPPFSVTEKEVSKLYQAHYAVTQKVAQDVLSNNTKFIDKGLDYMNESVYQLTAK